MPACSKPRRVLGSCTAVVGYQTSAWPSALVDPRYGGITHNRLDFVSIPYNSQQKYDGVRRCPNPFISQGFVYSVLNQRLVQLVLCYQPSRRLVEK